MRMSLRLSCLVHPFSMESGSTEVNTRVRGTLALGINPNLGSSPGPLRERVDNLWMSLLGMALSCLYQPPFLNISIHVQELKRAGSAPRGVSYLNMWRGGRPAVSTVNGCGHRGRGDGAEGDPELMFP
jgi:hypothetical protein